MSSWGYTDNVAIAGTVTTYTANGRVVGSSTYFTSNVNAGDYLTIGGKKYQVETVSSDTVLNLTNSAAAAASSQVAYLQQGPKFLGNISAMGGSDTNRQNNVVTIQNVYGVDRDLEMALVKVNSIDITDAGAGYRATANVNAIVANTSIVIATTGLSQPTSNATATMTFTANTLTAITITNPGSGYNSAAQANTTVTISTTGLSQPTTNATASITFTESTKAANASHQGWVHRMTWTDANGNARQRNEVLVALSKNATASQMGDDEDTQYPE